MKEMFHIIEFLLFILFHVIFVLSFLAPFVVKHIVYKDTKDKAKNSSKENIELDRKGKKSVQEKNTTDRTQRVLRERNPNINTNTVKDTFRKQSYSDWKKSQPRKGIFPFSSIFI